MKYKADDREERIVARVLLDKLWVDWLMASELRQQRFQSCLFVVSECKSKLKQKKLDDFTCKFALVLFIFQS